MTTDPIEALRARRKELEAEVARVDRALAILTGNEVIEPSPSAAKPTTSKPINRTVKRKARGPRPSKTSVKSRVRTLLGEEDREWRTPQIVEEFVARGKPLKVKSPKHATRTALSALIEDGEVARVREGVYKHAKFVTIEEMWSTDKSDDDADLGIILDLTDEAQEVRSS